MTPPYNYYKYCIKSVGTQNNIPGMGMGLTCMESVVKSSPAISTICLRLNMGQ